MLDFKKKIVQNLCGGNLQDTIQATPEKLEEIPEFIVLPREIKLRISSQGRILKCFA